MELREIKRIISESSVEYLLLQFTDIFGRLKGVEVAGGGLDEVLTHPLAIDAGAIAGPTRAMESDGCLKPDLSTFALMPFTGEGIRGARLIADLFRPDGLPDEKCPRHILRKVITQTHGAGLEISVAPEVEFFILRRKADGGASFLLNDPSGYLDFSADEPGQDFRRQVVSALEKIGIRVHHAHHEVAPGQHEIGLLPMLPLECADAIISLRFVTKAVAKQHGFIATFMPKPRASAEGSGMHISFSARREGRDAFHTSGDTMSREGRGFMAGLLAHAEGLCLLLNPLVNSYKRLVPGFEAPTHVYWSTDNLGPYVRVPASGEGPAVIEVRGPDPSCNPYLSLAAMIAAGLEGIEEGLEPGEPVEKDIRRLSGREKGRLRVKGLPANLGDAVEAFVKDRLIAGVLGSVAAKTLIRAKTEEWLSYLRQVHPWELENYLSNT